MDFSSISIGKEKKKIEPESSIFTFSNLKSSLLRTINTLTDVDDKDKLEEQLAFLSGPPKLELEAQLALPRADIRPGVNIRFNNLGVLYDGIWHVSEVKHDFGLQGNRTTIKCVKGTEPSIDNFFNAGNTPSGNTES